MYGQGEGLHIAIWPGGSHNTQDIARFIALESRSYVLSVFGLMRASYFPKDTPHLLFILAKGEDILANEVHISQALMADGSLSRWSEKRS